MGYTGQERDWARRPPQAPVHSELARRTFFRPIPIGGRHAGSILPTIGYLHGK